MKMSRLIIWVFALLPLSFLSLPANADHDHHERHESHERWHGDIHSFERHDLPVWRGGHWHHGLHDGRLGWWWIISDLWYYYPQPVYPYPNPYTPPVVVVPPGSPETTIQIWYYCDSERGYYPYVSSCPEGWRAVPSVPPNQ